MYRRLLVPLDGSELSEVVYPYVIETAGRLGMDVTLLHVLESEERESSPLHRAYIEHKAEMVAREIGNLRRKIGSEGDGTEAEVRGELVAGYPAEEIMRYAEEGDIDLITMVTHGRSGIRRWIMGSVADKVLRASTLPVWLVSAESAQETPYNEWPERNIVVPLDGSELAESVLPHVDILAGQRGPEPLEVVLLNVSEPAVAMTYYSPSARLETPDGARHVMPREYQRELLYRQKLVAKRYLEGVAQRLRLLYRDVRTEVLEGDPSKEIIEYVEKLPFSVIVMSTHARGGLGRWAYGSVAAKLLQKVPVPMVLVRPHEQAEG